MFSRARIALFISNQARENMGLSFMMVVRLISRFRFVPGAVLHYKMKERNELIKVSLSNPSLKRDGRYRARHLALRYASNLCLST
jgi:hypothetical protein